MFELTSPALFVLVTVLAILVPLAIVVLGAHRRTVTRSELATGHGGPLTRGDRGRLVRTLLGHLGLILLSQLLALMSLGLYVNDQYGFFSSWADLLGQTGGQAPIATAPALASGLGGIRALLVKGEDARTTADVIVWTPAQYASPHYATWRFPVVLFLPGQPSTPTSTIERFDFARLATHAIAAHQVPPFVAVFPPIMIRPPRDTECTNVPGGPQAESWLTHDVTQAVAAHYRVVPPGTHWSVLGWSTGGFCAAKLVLAHPALYGAAVSLGGYYTAITDHTTGNLFGSNVLRRDENSPMWLYEHGGMHSRHLLLVVGRQDGGSWRSTEAMLATTRGNPLVSSLVFANGGHNYHNYRTYLPRIFDWLLHVGTL